MSNKGVCVSEIPPAHLCGTEFYEQTLEKLHQAEKIHHLSSSKIVGGKHCCVVFINYDSEGDPLEQIGFTRGTISSVDILDHKDKKAVEVIRRRLPPIADVHTFRSGD